MFLSKNKETGIYYIFYYDALGKRRKRSTGEKTKAKALKYLEIFQRIQLEENAKNVVPIMLYKYIREFTLHYYQIHTKKTSEAYENMFKFFKQRFEDVLIHTQDIEEYLLERNAKSIYQARKDRINLSSAFERAKKKGIYTRESSNQGN